MEKKYEKGKQKKLEYWWHDTFGVAGPLISSLIGLLSLIIAILLMDYFGTLLEFGFVSDIVIFLQENLTLFFGLMVFISYTTFYSRFNPGEFSWVLPVSSALSIMITVWVLVNVFTIVNIYWEVSFIDRLTNFFTEDILLAIFAIIIVIGYLFMYANFFFIRAARK